MGSKVVRLGLTWPWIFIPKVSFPPTCVHFFSRHSSYVSEMLQKRVIKRTVGKVFVFCIFTVPKKDSDKAGSFLTQAD